MSCDSKSDQISDVRQQLEKMKRKVDLLGDLRPIAESSSPNPTTQDFVTRKYLKHAYRTRKLHAQLPTDGSVTGLKGDIDVFFKQVCGLAGLQERHLS